MECSTKCCHRKSECSKCEKCSGCCYCQCDRVGCSYTIFCQNCMRCDLCCKCGYNEHAKTEAEDYPEVNIESRLRLEGCSRARLENNFRKINYISKTDNYDSKEMEFEADVIGNRVVIKIGGKEYVIQRSMREVVAETIMYPGGSLRRLHVNALEMTIFSAISKLLFEGKVVLTTYNEEVLKYSTNWGGVPVKIDVENFFYLIPPSKRKVKLKCVDALVSVKLRGVKASRRVLVVSKSEASGEVELPIGGLPVFIDGRVKIANGDITRIKEEEAIDTATGKQTKNGGTCLLPLSATLMPRMSREIGRDVVALNSNIFTSSWTHVVVFRKNRRDPEIGLTVAERIVIGSTQCSVIIDSDYRGLKLARILKELDKTREYIVYNYNQVVEDWFCGGHWTDPVLLRRHFAIVNKRLLDVSRCLSEEPVDLSVLSERANVTKEEALIVLNEECSDLKISEGSGCYLPKKRKVKRGGMKLSPVRLEEVESVTIRFQYGSIRDGYNRHHHLIQEEGEDDVYHLYRGIKSVRETLDCSQLRKKKVNGTSQGRASTQRSPSGREWKTLLGSLGNFLDNVDDKELRICGVEEAASNLDMICMSAEADRDMYILTSTAVGQRIIDIIKAKGLKDEYNDLVGQAKMIGTCQGDLNLGAALVLAGICVRDKAISRVNDDNSIEEGSHYGRDDSVGSKTRRALPKDSPATDTMVEIGLEESEETSLYNKSNEVLSHSNLELEADRTQELVVQVSKSDVSDGDGEIVYYSDVDELHWENIRYSPDTEEHRGSGSDDDDELSDGEVEYWFDESDSEEYEEIEHRDNLEYKDTDLRQRTDNVSKTGMEETFMEVIGMVGANSGQIASNGHRGCGENDDLPIYEELVVTAFDLEAAGVDYDKVLEEISIKAATLKSELERRGLAVIRRFERGKFSKDNIIKIPGTRLLLVKLEEKEMLTSKKSRKTRTRAMSESRSHSDTEGMEVKAVVEKRDKLQTDKSGAVSISGGTGKEVTWRPREHVGSSEFERSKKKKKNIQWYKIIVKVAEAVGLLTGRGIKQNHVIGLRRFFNNSTTVAIRPIGAIWEGWSRKTTGRAEDFWLTCLRFRYVKWKQCEENLQLIGLQRFTAADEYTISFCK